MPRYTGAFHVHSRFSDGELGLEQIASLARAQHLDFIVCGDHATHLSSEDRVNLVQRCAELSVEGLLVMPGLEFELQGRHVVVLGPGELLRELDATTAVSHPEQVRARGGFTIWAHPAVTFAWSLKRPLSLAYDAWEIWNRRADGELPSLPLVTALRKAIRAGRRVQALAGTDFHRGSNIPGPFVTLEAATELTWVAALEALRQGQYEICGWDGWDGMIDATGEGLTLGLSRKLRSGLRYRLQRVRCVLALARYRCMVALRLK